MSPPIPPSPFSDYTPLPGAWDEVFGALHRIGYEGWATMECNLSGEPEQVLPVAVAFVRERIAASARSS